MNLLIVDEPSARLVLPLHDPRSVHLRRVLRVRPGQSVRIGCTNGPTGRGIVRNVGAPTVIDVAWNAAPQPRPAVALAVGHPRPPVLGRLLRDLATIGIDHIAVFGGALSERGYLRSSVWDDAPALLRRGLQQGEHTNLPTLSRHESVTTALAALERLATQRVAESVVRLVAHRTTEPVEIAPRAVRSDAYHLLCVGPERGLTTGELDALDTAGYRCVGLGSTTLRTEIAANLLCSLAAMRDSA